jgi:hypothetical protein
MKCKMADAMVRAAGVATKKSVKKFGEESKVCMSLRIAAVLDGGRGGDQAKLLTLWKTEQWYVESLSLASIEHGTESYFSKKIDWTSEMLR